jgi:hypothetical protein
LWLLLLRHRATHRHLATTSVVALLRLKRAWLVVIVKVDIGPLPTIAATKLREAEVSIEILLVDLAQEAAG